MRLFLIAIALAIVAGASGCSVAKNDSGLEATGKNYNELRGEKFTVKMTWKDEL